VWIGLMFKCLIKDNLHFTIVWTLFIHIKIIAILCTFYFIFYLKMCLWSRFYLLTLLTLVKGDYSCLCNYDVEAGVLSQPDPNSHVIGYMYEFDCKPSFGAFTGEYYGVQFEHKVRIKYGPAFLFCWHKGSAITKNLSIIVQNVWNKRIHFQVILLLINFCYIFLYYKTRDFLLACIKIDTKEAIKITLTRHWIEPCATVWKIQVYNNMTILSNSSFIQFTIRCIYELLLITDISMHLFCVIL